MTRTDYLFEISLILDAMVTGVPGLKTWAHQYCLPLNHYVFIPKECKNAFLAGCEATYMLFNDSIKSEIFLSLTSKEFFRKVSLQEDVESLNSLLNELYDFVPFNFCIANIETTSTFTNLLGSSHFQPDDFLYKSEFIAIPNKYFDENMAQDFHTVLVGENCTLLYNRNGLILYPYDD